MTEAPLRRSGVLTFPGSPKDEAMAAAILITQDDEGQYHQFTQAGAGYQSVPDDLAEMFAQAVELINLNPEGNSHGE